MGLSMKQLDERLTKLEERLYALEDNFPTAAVEASGDDGKSSDALRAVISALIALRSQGARITALRLQEKNFPNEEVSVIGDVATDSRMLESAGKDV